MNSCKTNEYTCKCNAHEVKLNLISKDDFKNRVSKICEKIATVIGGSMGPYGKSTVIQTVDNVYTTKDGWNIMNQLNFGDITDNAIAKMIINVAQSVVLKVGDGTTSSVVVANEMNRFISKYMEDHPQYTSRDIENGLRNAVNLIIDELNRMATPITNENKVDAIRKIALVSTNWDTELSDLIAEIYKNTDNPIIKIQDSGTEKSYIEINEGYDLSAKLLAPDIFMTDNECVVDEPMILVFDHGIKETDFITLYSIAGTLNNNEMIGKPKLVILAPSFEEGFITRMRATLTTLIKSGKFVNMPLIPVKYTNTLVVDRECVSDFTALIGGVMISKSSTEFKDMYKNLSEFILAMAKNDPSIGENPQDALTEKLANISEYIIQNHAGGCDSIKIDDKHIVASGLTSANTEIVENTKKLLINEIDKLNKEADAHTTLTEGLKLKKIRLGKLNCNMGTIMLGGYGDAYLKAKRDALDDATRACEAAHRNGYVCGNGIATICAIKSIREKNEPLNTMVVEMLRIIEVSFFKIFFTLNENSIGKRVSNNIDEYDKAVIEFGLTVENNSHLSDDLVKSLSNEFNYLLNNLMKCITNKCAFDIISNKVDTNGNIINPVDVDIEVIKGCLRLVLISISSNQMLFKYFD